MEEQKIKVTEKEAKNIIIQKLRNRKIICSLGNVYKADITNENFTLEINSSHYYSRWGGQEREYDKVTIQISTTSYPHIRRRFKEFDVINGDYKSLAEKVNFIIQEDLKLKETQKIIEQKENYNLEIIKEKLKGLGARKEHYGDNYIIKNKYFRMEFSAYADSILINIKENENMTIEQAIELINKLKE